MTYVESFYGKKMYFYFRKRNKKIKSKKKNNSKADDKEKWNMEKSIKLFTVKIFLFFLSIFLFYTAPHCIAPHTVRTMLYCFRRVLFNCKNIWFHIFFCFFFFPTDSYSVRAFSAVHCDFFRSLFVWLLIFITFIFMIQTCRNFSILAFKMNAKRAQISGNVIKMLEATKRMKMNEGNKS